MINQQGRWLKMALVVTVVAAALALSACPGRDGALDKAVVRQKMEAIISFVDSPGYAAAVSWEEHVVLSYRLAQRRHPTTLEFAMLRRLRVDPGLRRSHVLSLTLARDEGAPKWQECRAFAEKVQPASFAPTPEDSSAAKALDEVPLGDAAKSMVFEPWDDTETVAAAPAAPKTVPGEAYNTYFGFLHAHSHLSLDADPEGTPTEAYSFAREQGGLDFFALTDHAVYLALWPWQNKWQQLRDAAAAANAPGEYVALWGFEWSNPLLGHISVLNTSDYTHTLKTARLKALYAWIAARPGAFGHFNHPGDYDYLGVEFQRFRPYSKVVPQLAGIETWNTDSGFGTYHYPGSGRTGLPYIDEANLQGWKLGALGSQDNHSRDWGARNEFRTGVLAQSLTREAIIDAYRLRRFYSTEDKDLYLEFRCAGYPMGTCVSGVAADFTVNAGDGSGDTFREIRLYRNGVLLQSQAVSGNEVSAAFSDPASEGGDYYYVMVTQTDDNDADGRDDEAISSPIWLEH